MLGAPVQQDQGDNRLSRLDEIIERWALASPHAVAAVINGKRITYTDLRVEIDAVAYALLELGVRKGDRVATLTTPHPDFLTTFLAAASIGAIWVGLNPKYRAAELQHVVSNSRPRLLFARTRIDGRPYEEEIAAMRAAAPSIEKVIVLNEDPLIDDSIDLKSAKKTARIQDMALAAARAACGGRDPCLLVYTSGSTGRPKGALLHHQGIVNFAQAQNAAWPVTPLRALNYFPVNHVGCVVDVSVPVLEAGGTIVFMEQFDPRCSLELMERERITMWGSVPSVFQLQLAVGDFETFDLSAVQLIVWEGAAMPAEMISALKNICPSMASNYGMTETTSGITIIAPTDDEEVLANSVGTPFEGVELRLVKADGTIAEIGEEGEIQARSRYNMLGYWENPEATAETLTDDGWLRTGDTGVRRPDGRYRLVGRIKEMYKSGGYNVYPREVEQVLESHPDVALAAVVAAPDTIWDEVGIAYIIARREISAETLAGFCRDRLANYKIPKLMVFEKELPLLPIGKVDKVALKRRAAEQYAGARRG